MSDDPVALRRKYGKYLPHQRANVDQVPLPFVNDIGPCLMLCATFVPLWAQRGAVSC